MFGKRNLKKRCLGDEWTAMSPPCPQGNKQIFQVRTSALPVFSSVSRTYTWTPPWVCGPSQGFNISSSKKVESMAHWIWDLGIWQPVFFWAVSGGQACWREEDAHAAQQAWHDQAFLVDGKLLLEVRLTVPHQISIYQAQLHPSC